MWSGNPQAAWNDDYGSKGYEYFDVWAPEMVREEEGEKREKEGERKKEKTETITTEKSAGGS